SARNFIREEMTMATTTNLSSATLQRLMHALEEAHGQLEATKARQHEPLAIIGMACRFPGADSPEAYWALLRDGADRVAEIPATRWNVDAYYDPTPATPGKTYVRQAALCDAIDQFDPHFFNMSPREAISLDPQQRLLLETSWQALERAGIAP